MTAQETASVERTPRLMKERVFTAHDGTDIFFRHWQARGDRSHGAVVLFHRGHEHGGRMAHLVEEVGLDTHDFYAWDARGHGRSDGPRGSAPDFATLVRDADTFMRHIRDTDGVALEDMAVIAQSVGAVIASAWVHDYAPPIRAMVLASPAFVINLIVPLARPALGLWKRLRGDFQVNSYVRPEMLTHDPERIASYKADPLITRPIAATLLLDLHDTAKRVVTDAKAITVPTQLLISGADKVVRDTAQHSFFAALGSAKKERHVLKGFYHDTLGEKDRAPVLAEVNRFITECFAAPVCRTDLREAHRTGYTRDEAETLASPLPGMSARGLYWAANRASLGVGGHLSRGLALGHETGFDSGSTLDYVYRNKAEGLGPIGRMMDRRYLDSIGWRGIRQRKVHVEEMIGIALDRLRDDGQPTRIVDIAAGHGRYVLEALADGGAEPDSILLRDYSARNVAAGRILIEEKHLEGIARFEQGNAFDGDDLARINPRPTLAIVSGLYELFADNDMVLGSLRGLAQAVPVSGYLVYTGQPWHPQLELIARALTSHRDGEAWVMRRRVQAEMDQLVAEAGFRKIEQRIDKWGIFTVGLAQRAEDRRLAARG